MTISRINYITSSMSGRSTSSLHRSPALHFVLAAHPHNSYHPTSPLWRDGLSKSNEIDDVDVREVGIMACEDVLKFDVAMNNAVTVWMCSTGRQLL